MNFSRSGKLSSRSHQAFKDKCFAIIGDKCAKCGSTKNLSIDHVDWRDKSINISTMTGKAWWDLVVDELSKCQALCEECHKKKSAKDLSEQFSQDVKHGTPSGYSHYGCRCNMCKNARQQQVRAWKIKTGRMRQMKPRRSMAICGTDSMYANGCRCESCGDAHREYVRSYRRNKKIES